jgi:citrate lyase subunit beta/citryl-CoA lyase
MNIRPRRSALYMPGANARALEKARTLPCDAVILDLEDAVAPDAKAAARDQVMAAVAARGFGGREVIVRINGLDTVWWEDDLDAAAKAGPDGVLVPKISKPTDLQTITAYLTDTAPGHRIWLWAMIETPLAVVNAADIAAVARDGETRLAGFVMGINDLAKETRARLMDGRGPMVSWLATSVLAAHAYGIDILDGVYNNIRDEQGFRRECIQGRDMGFDGKTLVHPNQIEPCNAAFSPTAEEIDLARRIIAVFERPENQAKGVVQLDGRMVERMHADIAKRTVAIADGIAALS